MFKIDTVHEGSPLDIKILYNIMCLLEKLVKEDVVENSEPVEPKLEELSRVDLLGIIKGMEERPKNYPQWTNDKLLNFIKSRR